MSPNLSSEPSSHYPGRRGNRFLFIGNCLFKSFMVFLLATSLAHHLLDVFFGYCTVWIAVVNNFFELNFLFAG